MMLGSSIPAQRMSYHYVTTSQPSRMSSSDSAHFLLNLLLKLLFVVVANNFDSFWQCLKYFKKLFKRGLVLKRNPAT